MAALHFTSACFYIDDIFLLFAFVQMSDCATIHTNKVPDIDLAFLPSQ